MAAGKKKKGERDERFRDIARNRRAFYEYEIVERVDAGLVLIGTEVKGLRERGATIGDAYVVIRHGEAWLVGATIPEYSNASHTTHEPQRTRKLLLHRREIDRLTSRLNEKGLTLVPLRMYFHEGRAKIELGLGRGKTAFDKRHSIAERDARRDIARAVRRG